MTDLEIKTILDEVHAGWLMDEYEEAAQPTAIRHLVKMVLAAERERCARKPLTAQQLDKLIEAHVGGSELTDGEYSAMVMFAAAVERAHGIGA
jgi:hypothetical protein